MTRSLLARLVFVGAGFVVALPVGCGSEKINQGSAKSSNRRRPAAASASASASASPLPDPRFEEQEFAESKSSRDPFRSYETFFLAKDEGNKDRRQRTVLLSQYSIDELRLIGIVHRANPTVAMLIDPNGKGHTIQRGQFVGRSEVVEGPGQDSAPYELNWRVERIREGDVVFVREDPANPDVPSATKVIPLRPEGSLEQAR